MRGSKVKSIYHVAAESGFLNTWVAAIEVIGLVELLEADDYLTVFAPSDEAFLNMSRYQVDDLLASIENLVANISNHIALGRILTRELSQLSSIRTLMKNDLLIESDRDLFVSGARIVIPNMQCRNGVIHVVDNVLMIRKRRQVKVEGAGRLACVR